MCIRWHAYNFGFMRTFLLNGSYRKTLHVKVTKLGVCNVKIPKVTNEFLHEDKSNVPDTIHVTVKLKLNSYAELLRFTGRRVLHARRVPSTTHTFDRLVVSSINDSTTRTTCHAGETVAVRVKESSHADW